MVKAGDICRFLEEMAPLRLAEPWDNVGLLLGRTGREVRCVMTCLTLTAPVAAEAVRREVQMIVTHHPVLFRGAKKITDATAEGRIVLELVESGIAVYSPHTAFDSAATGINQRLAESIGLRDIRPLRISDQGTNIGAGRCGTFPRPMAKDEFLKGVREVVGADFLEFAWSGPEYVRTVAVACGSAAEFLDDAVREGCEVFVTGEARFHAVLESQSHGVSLVLTGHFPSERPAVIWLASALQEKFPDVQVFASGDDQNPLELYVAEK